MADDREKISTGPNAEPINETLAGTGPGIPDDALEPEDDLHASAAYRRHLADVLIRRALTVAAARAMAPVHA